MDVKRPECGDDYSKINELTEASRSANANVEMHPLFRWCIGTVASVGVVVMVQVAMVDRALLLFGIIGTTVSAAIALACFSKRSRPVTARIVGAACFLGFGAMVIVTFGSVEVVAAICFFCTFGLCGGYFAVTGKWPSCFMSIPLVVDRFFAVVFSLVGLTITLVGLGMMAVIAAIFAFFEFGVRAGYAAVTGKSFNSRAHTGNEEKQEEEEEEEEEEGREEETRVVDDEPEGSTKEALEFGFFLLVLGSLIIAICVGDLRRPVPPKDASPEGGIYVGAALVAIGVISLLASLRQTWTTLAVNIVKVCLVAILVTFTLVGAGVMILALLGYC